MKTALLITLLLIPLTCNARTFGCFMGVIGVSTERNIEVDYMHYQVFSKTKHTSELLPFLGCGVSFDF